MKIGHCWILGLAAMAAIPAVASARPLSVDLWTDRGRDAVFKPGEILDLKVRVSDDAHLLIYEIDSEGYLKVVYPTADFGGYLEGKRTHRIAEEYPDFELVVQGPVGQGYFVAIASREPLLERPWFLRARDPRAEELGYAGGPEEEEGITAEGRVVGDPFVAMERIRRRLVREFDDDEAFATSYLSYYVHERVRYPRYLCDDCHRPGHWSWWDGYDPYYSTCSAFSVRVNWNWYWGPTYWFGTVPYYVYSYAPGCPPYIHRVDTRRGWWSSWDGWNQWCASWPRYVTRYKSPPPVGYVPPEQYDRKYRRGELRTPPPGFLTQVTKRSDGRMIRTADVGVGRSRRINDRGDEASRWRRATGNVGRLDRPVRDDTPEPRRIRGPRDEGLRDRPDGPRESSRDNQQIRKFERRERTEEPPRVERSVERGKEPAPRPRPVEEKPKKESGSWGNREERGGSERHPVTPERSERSGRSRR